MNWVWGMRKIIMWQPDYALLQVTLKITWCFCFLNLFSLYSTCGCHFGGLVYKKLEAKVVLVCGYERIWHWAEMLAAHVPRQERWARRGLSSTRHMAAAPKPTWGLARSHLEAWQMQLLAGSWPILPALKVLWCYCENNLSLHSWKVTLPLP